jgi:hypothetical protein
MVRPLATASTVNQVVVAYPREPVQTIAGIRESAMSNISVPSEQAKCQTNLKYYPYTPEQLAESEKPR